MAYFQILLNWDRFAYHIISRMLYNPLLFFFFETITSLVDLTIFLIFVYWLYLLFFNKQRFKEFKLGAILTPVIIAAIITLILKVLIHRGSPTPFVMPWLEIQLLPVHYSFPSGHASRAFAFATALALRFPSKWPLFFFGSALIGFSRIYIGAHFPLDVIAGAILGIFVSALSIKLATKK